MFVEWGFLLAEIWVLIALGVLVGLIAGWLIWGGSEDFSADAEEARLLRAELERARAQNRAALDAPAGNVLPKSGGPAPSEPTATKTADRPAAPVAQSLADNVGTKPEGLDAPRDGLPDDLTKIKGVGTKLQGVCNSLGYWHYEQIANWSDDEVAWVDENLEGFKGRVTRDLWVEQAKALAVNETPAFVRRRD